MDTQLLVWGLIALVVLVGGYFGGKVLIGRLVLAWTLWRLPMEQRVVFDQKVRLLESPAIVEFLAPMADHQRDYGEDEKRRKPVATLTPWPKAVLALWKKNKASSKFVDVKAQVRRAASLLTVEELPDELQPENAGPGHFAVVVPLLDKTEQQVKALASQLKGKLGLHSIEAELTTDFLSVAFVCHTEQPQDRLAGKTIGVDWLAANAAQSPMLLPLALRENGEAWSLPTHHTLIYGLTGAGKGSVLHGVVRQLAPFVRRGEVELWGIDPKYEDLDKYRLSGLFGKVVSDQVEGESLVSAFFTAMKSRQQARQSARESGTVLDPIGSQAAPYEILLVDEFSSFLLEAQSKRGATIMPKFTAILAQGRSLGFYVIAAAQNIDKELLQRTRTNFVNAIALRAENDYWSDFVLGNGAAAAGFDASKILPATPANRYATAGLGFVKEASGEPIKVRFAFSSDGDIEALTRAFPLTPEQQQLRSDQGTALRLAAEQVERKAEQVEATEKRPAPADDLASMAAQVKPVGAAPRVASIEDVRSLPDDKLRELQAGLARRLERQESAKGRNMLQTVETELRIREEMAAMPQVVPDDPYEIELPDLSQGTN